MDKSLVIDRRDLLGPQRQLSLQARWVFCFRIGVKL